MVKKLFFLFLSFLLFSSNIEAQRTAEKGWGIVNLERHQFKFNILGPGVNYELGLFKNVTASGGLGFGAASYQEGYALGLTLHTRVRYYHNFNRRLKLNKVVSGNSGNYLAVARSIFFFSVTNSHKYRWA